MKEGWILDGPCFKTPLYGIPGVVPVFQYHYVQSKEYGGWRFHFSTSPNISEEGWIFDKIAFFAFPQAIAGAV